MKKYRNESQRETLRSRTLWVGRDLLLRPELRHVTKIMGVLLGQPSRDFRESDLSPGHSCLCCLPVV